MADGLPSASLLENARLNALLIVPNAVQGIFRRRRHAVAAATKAGVDGHAIGLLSGMARSYDRRPVWVRVATDRALLVLDPGDARRVLDDSPDPFASDPEAKRKGMAAFQPEALTISRGTAWESRRRFTEAVLDTRNPPHRLAERFVAITREEVERMLAGPVALAGGELRWEALNAAIQRTARRVILGDGAAADTELTERLEEMMSEANGMPGKPSEKLEPFMARLATHLERAEEGSLAGLFADAPADERTAKAGQVPHWMFALGDTLAINAFRALALLAAHPVQRRRVADELGAAERADGELTAAGVGGLEYLEACLQEAMRLWPTTPVLSRETLAETEWDGERVPAGTQVLIVNTFAHRDRDRLDYADRFAPEEWIDGDAATEPAFNHFSGGPQGCPGEALALLIGKAALAELLSVHDVRLREPDLDPDRPLPRMLDFFGLRLAVEGA